MALFAFGNSTIEIADAVNRGNGPSSRGAVFDCATRTIATTYQEKPRAPRHEIGITILVECAAAPSHASSSIQFVLDTLQTVLTQRAAGSLRQHLRNALHYAHEQMLHTGSHLDGASPAQLSVTLAAIAENRLYISRVGAQRAYLFDGQSMQSITPDPPSGLSADVSYLGTGGALRIVDQMLVPTANGERTAASMSDTDHLVLQPGLVVIVCSDAISNVMSAHVMRTIVAESLAGYAPPSAEDEDVAGDLLEAARRLTAWAETGCSALLFRWQHSAAPVSVANKWPKVTSALIIALLMISVVSLSFTLRQIWTLYWGDAIAAQSQVSLTDSPG
ncbi:MAG: hypothetical protein KDE50_17600, partial [Caldilineaceae bacterium]|nr:hypothetical protein [Caldilineaceae bacterium]